MPVAALLACFVIGIADGDTLTARCETAAAVATNVVVRLAGIDAPEKGQAFGQRSRQALAALCFKKRAEIHPVATDRYGRTVARVVCDRVDASAEQVRVGLAWAYTRYDADKSATKLERGAREQRLGLWADPSPIAPWDWRRSTTARCDGAPPWPKSCHVSAER
jgi:micrococcal nuclease